MRIILAYLAAFQTFKRPFSSVRPHMNDQVSFTTKTLFRLKTAELGTHLIQLYTISYIFMNWFCIAYLSTLFTFVVPIVNPEVMEKWTLLQHLNDNIT